MVQTSGSKAVPAWVHRIVLGTAQLGSDYGVSNTNGRVREKDAFQLLDRAWEVGIRSFDTARGYGESEAVLGRWLSSNGLAKHSDLQIITKFAPQPGLPLSPSPGISKTLRRQFEESYRTLGVNQIDTWLFHRVDDAVRAARLDPEGTLDWLVAEKEMGRLKRLGVSLYDEDDLSKMRGIFDLDRLQVPGNCADRRYRTLDLQYPDVHVRSAFLQGLLFLGSARLPPFLAPAYETLLRLEKLARRLKTTLPAFSLSYVLSWGQRFSPVLGFTRREELDDLIRWDLPEIPGNIELLLDEALSDLNPDVLDPRKWPAKSPS